MLRFGALIIVSTSCGGSSSSARITIGALLPFTGERAESGAAIQQALILAGERINAAGGISGRPLHIDVRDTRSTLTTGVEEGEALLARADVMGLVGPEEDEVGLALLPALKRHQRAMVSGGLISPKLETTDSGGYFFRTNPTAVNYGRALALRVVGDGKRRVSILYSSNEYGAALGQSMAAELTRLGATVLSTSGAGKATPFEPGQRSYVPLLKGLQDLSPEVFVLIADPPSGADIIRDWWLIGRGGTWYFSPSLQSEAFVRLAPPGVVNGMVGVAPAIRDAQDFGRVFSERWPGDVGGPTAAFYYDAVALLALALQSAAVAGGGAIDPAALPEHISRVAGPPGRSVSWRDLGAALEAVRQGQEIDYDGVSGFVDFDGQGNIKRPSTVLWRVEGDTFVRE